MCNKRIRFRRNGKDLPTKHVILTFQKTVLPESVKAGYLYCRVRPYIPNPRRCFRCQRFGHSSHSCRSKPSCAKCASVEHDSERCVNDLRCVNCNGPHASYSRSCPRWQEEKDIMTLKVTENLTYIQAKKRVAFTRKGTFAEAARRGAVPPKASKEVQVSPEDFTTPPLPPPTQKRDSRASAKGALVVQRPRSRDAARTPSPAKPKSQRAARTPSVSRESAVQSATQTQNERDIPLSEPTEEDMDCGLSASQSTLSSASAEATGKPKDTTKKKVIPRVTAPKVTIDLG